MPNPSVPPAGPKYVTVRGGYRVSFDPDASNDRRWLATGAGIRVGQFYSSLYILADAYGLDFSEVRALMALVDGPAALPPSADAPSSEGEITDADRIDAIQRTVAATEGGVSIHDATPEWSTVVEHDGEVCGRGQGVRAALDQMVREDRMVRELLASHGVAMPGDAALRPSADAAPVTSGETVSARALGRAWYESRTDTWTAWDDLPLSVRQSWYTQAERSLARARALSESGRQS